MKKIITTLMIMSVFLFFTGINCVEAEEGVYFDNYDEIDFEGETVNVGGDLIESYLSEETIEEAEEIFNVKIENMDWLSNEEKISRLMAGDSKYDLWKADIFDLVELVANDAVLPISEVVDEKFEKDFYDAYMEEYSDYSGMLKKLNEFGTFGGVTYTLWDINPVFGYFRFTYFNKNIIEDEGLEDPYELYENDEWTWDKFREMMVEATRDIDGDGEIDQWGLNEFWSPWDDIFSLIYANDGDMFTLEDEKFNYNFDSEPVIEATREFIRWREEDEITIADDEADNFSDGETLFYMADVIPVAIQDWPAYGDGGEYGLVPIPRGPNAEEHKTWASSAQTLVLPLNSEYPEGMIALYDFFFSREEELYDDDIRETSPDRKAYEIIKEYSTNDNIEIARTSLADEQIIEMFEEILAGERGVEEAFEAYEPAIQGKVDELYRY
ncbi:MAG: ABC transporter substrate-binding protein [Halanaerobiales bacterium]